VNPFLGAAQRCAPPKKGFTAGSRGCGVVAVSER
jgi:hypothetical protein